LTYPLPKELGRITLFITRNKSGFGDMHVKYRLYNTNNSGILLNSKKKFACSTTYHLVSSAFEEFDKSKESFIGKIRADSQKHIYHVYDNGSTSNSTSPKNVNQRKELCILPFIDESEEPHCPISKSNISKLVEKYERGTENIVFQTEESKWDDEAQEYVLPFDTQIWEQSVKNFRLELKSGIPIDFNESPVFLEFGKVEKDRYQMTLRWPFSILAAFSVAVSAIEGPVIN
jgi:hypothetical protein